jgi:hypothetical protein
MINSDLLLLMIPDVKDNAGIVTGKVFEYMATNILILAIGPKDGDAAKILKETASGIMFDYQEPIDDILIKEYNKWESNLEKPSDLSKAVSVYERKNLTKQLVNILDQ